MGLPHVYIQDHIAIHACMMHDEWTLNSSRHSEIITTIDSEKQIQYTHILLP